jgi:CDP-glycerol glycerophosphotransferase (TagB/SpsB family)
MLNKLKRLAIILINIPLRLIIWVVPKNRNIWVFGAWYGKRFSDNSYFLFKYINERDSRIKAVWLVKDRILLKEIASQGYRVYHAFSFWGYYYSSIAKVIVVSSSITSDVNVFAISNRTLKVQLWHGIPLKKIGFDDQRRTKRPVDYIKKLLEIDEFSNYDLIISTSKDVSEHFSTAFSVHSEKIKVTGYPRNDILFENRDKCKQADKRKVLYAPTYRGGLGDKFDLFKPYKFNREKMENLLETYSAELYINIHYANLPDEFLLNRPEDSSNIFYLNHENINTILNTFDVLITDYSGIYIDFLLIDKPIIFSSFDINDYACDRGFYYDYNKVTPGPIATNWTSIENELERLFKGGDKYKSLRQQVKDLFHKYQDNKSCERVFDMINDQLKVQDGTWTSRGKK